MGSSGKKRTTAAKLNREGRLREKRFEKEARKAERKRSAAHDSVEVATPAEEFGEDSAEFENELEPDTAP